MEKLSIKPENEHKTIMFIEWCILLAILCIFMMPLIIFIPEAGAKIAFSIAFAVLLMVMVLYALWIPAYFKTLDYCIDKEAVRMSKGVFWKRRVTVPYDKITNVDISQGPLERMYNVGKIHVQTAGAGGPQGANAELRLLGVRNLEDIKETIMEGVRGQKQSLNASQEIPKSDSDILSAILEELKAIKNHLQRG
ncbi:PH domain-containing protein [Candidatus Latescibacterota bacterium]